MEIFDILTEQGEITGTASREICHSGSFFLHGVVHVLVFTDAGKLILQKRSSSKDIEPGKWDTSVGGHILSGETLHEALLRETQEELGITGAEFTKMYTFIIESDIEREYVTAFHCVWNGLVQYSEDEIEEVRCFTCEKIESKLGTGCFTPAFEIEWVKYKEWSGKD